MVTRKLPSGDLEPGGKEMGVSVGSDVEAVNDDVATYNEI